MIFSAALIAGLICHAARAATIDLTIKFSNSSLRSSWFNAVNSTENRVFGISWSSCLQTPGNDITLGGTPTCPSGEAPFEPEEWYVTTNDNVADSTWFKKIDVPETYTGPITIYLFAPLTLGFTDQGVVFFDSSVTDCLSLADNEMGGEFCGAHGQPWTVTITDPKQVIALTAYPAFSMATKGETVVLLENFYSTQLDNNRNVSVYLPPSVIQNKMERPINIMILLDGAHSVVESFASRTGFESLQIAGVMPESIMIGITTVEFAYAGNFNQRTYELTYEQAMSYPEATCIDGSFAATGGADLLLQWIDKEVIPAALNKLGMLRGEVSITGGSLGGLTSCYAASKYPEVFARAVCSSPSNCYNFGNGGLASVIASNYAASGKAPKAVIQFLGAEALSGDGRLDGDEYQMQYLIRDDDAWQSIGMTPVTFESIYTAETPDAYGFRRAKALPAHIVMTMIIPGGQHAPPTWQQTLSAALPILYRADRPDKTRIPKSESLAYYSLPAPTATPSDTSSSSSDNGIKLSAGEVAACVIVPTVATIVALVAYFSFVLKPQLLARLGDQTISKQSSPFQRQL